MSPARALLLTAACSALVRAASAGSMNAQGEPDESFAVAHQAAIYVITSFAERGVRVVRLAFNGDALWQEWIGGPATEDRVESAVVGRDGSLYVGGAAKKNSLLARLSSSGGRLWSKGLDPWQENRVHRVALDEDQNLYASGTRFNGKDWDAFLVKLNSSGDQVWRFVYDAGGNEYGVSLGVDAEGASVSLIAERATPSGFSRERVWLDRNGQRAWR